VFESLLDGGLLVIPLTHMFAAGELDGVEWLAISGWQGTKTTYVESPTLLFILMCSDFVWWTCRHSEANYKSWSSSACNILSSLLSMMHVSNTPNI